MGTQNPPGTFSSREVVRIALGSGATGLVLGLVGGSFSASGIVSMTVAAAMLIIAWAVGAFAITVSEPIWGLPTRYRLVVSLGAIVALAMVLGGIGWFQYAHMPIQDRGTARLNLKQVIPLKMPGEKNTKFNINIQNDGNAIALNETTLVSGKLSLGILAQGESDAIMEKMHQIVADAEKHGPNHVQLSPTIGRIVTLSDINSLDKDFIEVTDAQLQEFNNGKLVLYVFVVSHYEDETIQGSAYWEVETCAYYVGSLAYFHNCGPMKTEKIVGHRFN